MHRCESSSLYAIQILEHLRMEKLTMHTGMERFSMKTRLFLLKLKVTGFASSSKIIHYLILKKQNLSDEHEERGQMQSVSLNNYHCR